MSLNRFLYGSIAGIFFLTAQGCTELKVYKVRSDQIIDKPGTITYGLPTKSFIVSATYILKNCETIIDKNTGKPSLNLDIDTSANVATSIDVDPDELYFIDYSELRSFWKETNVTLESYPNKTLKTFNGQINDQTGPIVTATIGTAIKIASVALAGEGVAGEQYCDSDVITTLSAIAAKRKIIAKERA